MLTRKYQPEDILPMLDFLPEHLQDMVSHLFSNPRRGSSYILQLIEPMFELSPKCIPEPTHISKLTEVFKTLYPHFDIEAGRFTDFCTTYTVEHVTTQCLV